LKSDRPSSQQDDLAVDHKARRLEAAGSENDTGKAVAPVIKPAAFDGER
jgi:hypothetical protein